MGNLIQNMREDELDELRAKWKKEEELGKPHRNFINVWIYDKSIEDLCRLYDSLKGFCVDYELEIIQKWIDYKKKKE
jgi:hypothetical protein